MDEAFLAFVIFISFTIGFVCGFASPSFNNVLCHQYRITQE